MVDQPTRPRYPLDRRWPLLFASVLWLGTALSALAHDPGLSSVRITVTPQSIAAVLTIHFVDLDAVAPGLDENHDGQLDASEFARARNRLTDIARQEVAIAVGDNTLAPALPASSARVELIGNNNLQMTGRFVLPNPSAGRRLTVTSRLIAQLPLGHRQFVEVLLGANGQGIGEGFLVASADQLTFDVPPWAADTSANVDKVPSSPPHQIQYGAFLFLGANHLLSGYDHLLFLAGLLIVCPSLVKAFQMLTLFTLAHTVTLTLVTLDLIRAPGLIIEPMIAASIAYIGVENILRPRADLSWRGGLTFVFGLVHGLGFAGALRELGVGTGGAGGVFQPLLYFSLGLELTQLGLAVLVFPLLLWLRTKPVYSQFGAPVCSALIALAGFCWFFQRTLFHA